MNLSNMDIQEQINELREKIDALYHGIAPSSQSFDRMCYFKKGIVLSNGAVLISGSSTTNATITTEVGTLPVGSIYVSSNGAGEIWVMQTSTWTKVTIP